MSLTAKFGFEGAKSWPIIRMFLIAVEKKQQQTQTTHPTGPQASQGFESSWAEVHEAAVICM